jgi:hypothetical protein
MSQASPAYRLAATLLSFLLVLPFAAFADDESGETEHLPFSELTFSEPERHYSPDQECVAPEDEMRRNHMEYILHQRDETMYAGIRTRQFALEECVNCHAVQDETSGEYIPVDAPNQFCSSCHSYTSVKLDCFECHAARPVRPSRLQHTQSSDTTGNSQQQIAAVEDKAQ